MLPFVINRTLTVPIPETSVMTPVKTFSMIALSLATLGTSLATSVTSASAEALWQYYHPRRAEVNQRLAYQNYRIHDGVEDGRISPWRAARLHAEDRMIRGEERFMARLNGGYITPAQQRALNQQENVVSRQIGP
jgi:hypothetical protein